MTHALNESLVHLDILLPLLISSRKLWPGRSNHPLQQEVAQSCGEVLVWMCNQALNKCWWFCKQSGETSHEEGIPWENWNTMGRGHHRKDLFFDHLEEKSTMLERNNTLHLDSLLKHLWRQLSGHKTSSYPTGLASWTHPHLWTHDQQGKVPIFPLL